MKLLQHYRKYLLFIMIYTIIPVFACVNQQDCNNHGNCINSQCQCDSAWTGQQCETANCVFGTISQNGNCKCDYKSSLVNGICTKECEHGIFLNTTGKCQCNENWKTAGITDTIDWVKGTCSQYQCKSSQQCASLLPDIANPSCPIKNWNCDCGFKKLGYSNDYAGCMSFPYLISIRAFEAYEYVSANIIWKIGLVLFIISLPFGRRRPYCDHHRSWMAAIKRKFGYPNRCNGECVYKVRWCVRDDLALSLYWLKSTIWWYSFSTCIILVLGYIWSLILWIAVILILLVVGVMMMCAACSEGGGGGNADCGNCGGCCCGDGCCTNTHSSSIGGNNYTTNIIYIGGPYPGNSCCFDCCYSPYYSNTRSTTRSTNNTTAPTNNLINRADTGNNDNNSSCCCCFKPLYYLAKLYPVFPENLYGGVLGYFMGTHITNSTYRGNNKFIDFLSLSRFRRNDLRHNHEWQGLVSKHLQSSEYSPPPPPQNNNMIAKENNTIVNINEQIPSETYNITKIEGVYINNYTYNIIKTDDIVNNEHIDENECWICNDTPTKWHVWKPCNHVFCGNCSEQMLERHMTCPLCRNAPIGIDSYQNTI